MQCDDVGELEEWGRKLQLIIQRLIVHEGFLVVSLVRTIEENAEFVIASCSTHKNRVFIDMLAQIGMRCRLVDLTRRELCVRAVCPVTGHAKALDTSLQLEPDPVDAF